MERAPAKRIVHLVSFNIPYPPDYGGIMDVFYKISALKRQGVGVILHCFSYGRSRSRTLERECLRVHYYRRELNLFHLFRKEPFIVVSRRNDMLLKDLLTDSHPIIFEGLHIQPISWAIRPWKERITMVRTHNIEHVYYRNLASNEKNPFRKLYYSTEASSSGTNRSSQVPHGCCQFLRATQNISVQKYGNAMFVGPFIRQTDHFLATAGVIMY